MDSTEIRAIVERYLECYNTFDVIRMMSLIHPEIEFRNISRGTVNAQASGEEQFRNLAELSTALFSERRQILREIAFAPDMATIEVEYFAVLKSDLPEGPKAGDTLHLKGRSIFKFQDGLIHRITDVS